MKAEYKVPRGKLLACEITLKNGVVDDVKISGDFFMHPEAAILDLEEAIRGTPIEDIRQLVLGFFEEKKVTLFGVSPLDFYKVIEKALDGQG